jgi:hypothetical protein
MVTLGQVTMASLPSGEGVTAVLAAHAEAYATSAIVYRVEPAGVDVLPGWSVPRPPLANLFPPQAPAPPCVVYNPALGSTACLKRLDNLAIYSQALLCVPAISSVSHVSPPSQRMGREMG